MRLESRCPRWWPNFTRRGPPSTTQSTAGKTITQWNSYPDLVGQRSYHVVRRVSCFVPADNTPRLNTKPHRRGRLQNASPLRKTTPHFNTVYKSLKQSGLTNNLCKKRPKSTRTVAMLRMRFSREYRHFKWRRRVVKFSDECLVQGGSGQQAEWCFRYPHKKYNPIMITEVEKAKGMSQMVWGMIWVTPNGRVGRSELVIMERDFASKTRLFGGLIHHDFRGRIAT
jgi:hypothetical protein